MPVVTYQLIAGQHDNAAIGSLLTKSALLFAEVTGSPVDRIRAFADERPATHACVGETLVSQSGASAPLFVFWLLEGRPIEQRHALMAGFTDLLVSELGVDRQSVRGAVHVVPPDNWAIAGVPASAVRRAEIEARAAGS